MRDAQRIIVNALNAGCTREEVIEALIQTAVFAGFPAAMNGLFAARDTFAEMDRRKKRKNTGGSINEKAKQRAKKARAR